VSIGGKILVILGVIALLFAGFLLFGELSCNSGNGGFALCFPGILYPASAIFGVVGIIAIASGLRLVRQARELPKSDESVEQSESLKTD
jgi:hypothetical protein